MVIPAVNLHVTCKRWNEALPFQSDPVEDSALETFSVIPSCSRRALGKLMCHQLRMVSIVKKKIPVQRLHRPPLPSLESNVPPTLEQTVEALERHGVPASPCKNLSISFITHKCSKNPLCSEVLLWNIS